MIAERYRVDAIEGLHVADDLGDHTAQTIAYRNHPGAVVLRRLHVKQVIYAGVLRAALQNVEGRQFCSFLHPQTTLDEEFENGPRPERIALGAFDPLAGALGGGGDFRFVPASQRKRSNVRHLALQVKDRRGHAIRTLLPAAFEARPHQIVPRQRWSCRRKWRERRTRLSGPTADVREERAHGD